MSPSAVAGRMQVIGRWAGPGACLLLLAVPTPAGMTAPAQAVAAVTAWMAIWWISEAVPIAVTALLPILLFPLLGVTTTAEVTRAYGHHLVFLFLGGFMIAVTLERWDLHRRLALRTIQAVGTGPRRALLGFMLATAFLSMWISNTATVMMMVPIAAAVAGQIGPGGRTQSDNDGFGAALMLGIAYAASIGGIATLIGTPPNAILAGMIEQMYGTRIGFAAWLAFGLPFAILFLGLAWWYLALRIGRPGTAAAPAQDGVIAAELRRLGPMSRAERRVLCVFAGVAAIWILRGLIDTRIGARIEDSTVAVAGALLLFLLPAGDGRRLLDWDTAVRIPWGVLLLFGGGFALAGGFEDSGLSTWLGEQLRFFDDTHPVLIVAIVATLVKFLTEVTSNTATATLLIPIMAGFAEVAGVHPYALMATTAVSASLAFMLPVATPPNAIVFGTPYVTVPQMARAGLWLNLIGIPLTTVMVAGWLPWVWNIPLLGPR